MEKVEISASPGGVQGLTLSEELALKEYAIEMCSRGLGLTRKMLQDAATFLVLKREDKIPCKFGPGGPSERWVTDFLRRHADLSFRVPEKLSQQRRHGTTPSKIQKHFEKLGCLLEENTYLPHNIWNADETSLNVGGAEPKVISRKGARTVQTTSGEKVASATLMIAVSANGEKMPPLYIFQGKRLSNGLLDYAPNGSIAAVQEAGWMTQELFYEFVKRFHHFLSLFL